MCLYVLERQKNILANEVKTLNSKKKIQVQLLCRQDEKDMKAIAETLTNALINKKKVRDLHVIRCMKASEIQDDIPLLLLCFATNEVAQGISTALKGISVSEKTAVVNVHLKPEDALPDNPSHLVLPIKECKSLGRIFDIAYTADNGIYQCTTNETNLLGKVYVIITGHNQEAKCDVANALIHQRGHFRPFSCRKTIKVNLIKTVDGRQLCIVTTPSLNTPAWTREEKRFDTFKSKIFLYIKDNDCVDTDDQWSINTLEKRFNEPGRQTVLVVGYNLRNTAVSEPTAAGARDLSVDAVPTENTASRPIFYFNKQDIFALKIQSATQIIEEIMKLLRSRTTVPTPVGGMDVDDRRLSQTAKNASYRRLESDVDDALLDTVKLAEGPSQNEEEEFRNIPLPQLEDDDRKLFRKTLTIGKARSNHVRVNVVGNQSAGKTTLVQRLQDIETKCPNPDQKSTEGLDISQVTTRCTERNGQRFWNTKRSGFEKELNLQRMAFALQHAMNQPETFQTAEMVSELEAGSEEYGESGAVQTLDQYKEQFNIKQKENYQQRVKRWRENSHEEFMYISYWDFAGQATYYSTHQAFMAPSAVYLLVIDLKLDLDKMLDEKVRFKTGILKQYTVEETVKFWISSIKAYTRDEKAGHAPFIVVGTHKDQVTEDQISNTFTRLRKVMRNITAVEFVAIDNTLPLDSDESLKALKNKILDLGLGVIDEKIPAQWIDLENSLLQHKYQGKGLIDFKGIEELDATLDMPMKDSDRIKAFLDHQHSRGWLLHFCHMDLKDIIILDPMLLANFFNTLLRDRQDYRLPSSENKGGIIHQDFIQEAAAKEFSIRYSAPEVQTLTNLLVHLHIIHKYKNGDCYFVPCLLPHRDNENKKNSRHLEKSPTLKLSFKDAFVPPAFYHLLTGALIEHRNITLKKDWLFNLYACFVFQRDTLRLETYWNDCSIFFELKNFSKVNKIVEPETNKTLELISILEERVEHVLSVFRQENTKYKLNIECPEHKGSFVDIKEARNKGEVMCTDKEMHAVSWDKISENFPLPRNKFGGALIAEDKPTEQKIGRLARQLCRENALSLTSKLKLENGNVIADRMLQDYGKSVELQLMHILKIWMDRNPDKPLKYLLEKLSKRGDYEFGVLAHAITNEVPLEEWSGLNEEFLDKSPTENVLAVISSFIGPTYQFLMLELGLKVVEIENTEKRYMHNTVETIIFNLLLIWQKKYKNLATVRKILDTLKFVGIHWTEMFEKLKLDFASPT